MLTIASTIEIASGVDMPRLGLGTYKTAEGAQVRHAVATALGLGYRAVDTASLYDNEAGVGVALAGSGVPREELFVTTKVWNDEQGYDTTLAAFERSATRLGMDYVDLYLVHWPISRHLEGTWRALEELRGAGRVRAIGVCNFLEGHLEALMEVAVMPPAVNQIEFHPRLQQPRLQEFCRQGGITIQAWAPLMRGGVLGIPELARIAADHDVTAAQVSLRWIIQSGHAVIPKSVHADRIAENADIFDFRLTDEQMAVIDALDADDRIGRHPDDFDS